MVREDLSHPSLLLLLLNLNRKSAIWIERRILSLVSKTA